MPWVTLSHTFIVKVMSACLGGQGGYKIDFSNTYLFVKLDEVWFILFLDLIATKVVGELVVGVRLASVCLLGWGKVCGWLWNLVQRNLCVLSIADNVQFDVGNFLVRDNSWVVCLHIAW